jgi:sulfite reductase alpha subunit-like flavoprotein
MASFSPATAKSLLILYGSETGVAEDVAYSLHDLLTVRLSREGTAGDTDVAVHSMETYDVTQLPSEEAVVFVVSTTGDGEVPHSMKALWAFILQRNLPASSLSGVRTAVFGLGDSAYEKYNAAARKLSARLRQLGSVPLLATGTCACVRVRVCICVKNDC